MKLTPLDIRRQEFKRVVRGIDPEEVSVFLDMVAGEYERVLRENKALSEELDGLKRKVEEFDGMKEAIQGAVVMAKKGADDALNQAKKEAQLKLKEAEVEAERLLEGSRREAAAIRKEMSDIRNQRSILISRMKSLLEGQMRMLEAYVGDWEDEAREMRLASEAADEIRAAQEAGVAGAPSWIGPAGRVTGKPWGGDRAHTDEQPESVGRSTPSEAVGSREPGGSASRAEVSQMPRAADPAEGEEALGRPEAANVSSASESEEGPVSGASTRSPRAPDLIRFLRGAGPLRPGPHSAMKSTEQED